jgi:hypothetical protein
VTRALAGEARRVLSTRSWWLLFPLMAVLTLVAFPMNDIAADVFGNFDPQGDDQVLEQLGMLASQRYTSGHSIGQLIAMLFGASLVTREHGRRTATPGVLAQPRRRTALVAKLAVAVPTSVALAMVAAAVTYALVQRDPIATAGLEAEILANPDRYSDTLPPEEIHAGVRRAVLVGLVGFPLWALIGVGLGAVVRRQAVAVVLGVALYLITFFVVSPAVAQAEEAAVLAVVPMFTHATAVDAIYDRGSGSLVAAVNPAATAVLAVLLCAAGTIVVARSSLDRRRPPSGGDGGRLGFDSGGVEPNPLSGHGGCNRRESAGHTGHESVS